MSYFRRILRGFLCLALGLCVLEVCARVDDMLTDGAPFFGPFRLEGSLFTADEFGITGKPYAHYRQWTLNSRGERGPEFLPDREHVICIGASETFGFAESPEMEYPRQLERELNAREGCARYQVLNLSHPGQTLVNFTRRINKVTADLRPRIAVVYPDPVFYFFPPSLDDDEVAGQKSSGFESRILAKISDLPLPEWAVRMRYEHHIRSATRHAVVLSRAPAPSMERFQRDLSLLLDRLEKNHVQPLLVTHANRFARGVLPEDRMAMLVWRYTMPTLDESALLDFENRGNDIIRKAAAARNIPLADAAARVSGGADFSDYAHFTNRGAHLVAAVIAAKLLEFDDPSGCKRTQASNETRRQN
jgi:hypothetical protein